jgi:hypothetical protein
VPRCHIDELRGPLFPHLYRMAQGSFNGVRADGIVSGRLVHLTPGQAGPVEEYEHGGPDRKTGKNDDPERRGLSQDAADHEGGEQA